MTEQVSLVPFSLDAIRALSRGLPDRAAQLVGLEFGLAWHDDPTWATDYLEYLRRYRPHSRLYVVGLAGEAIGRVGTTRQSDDWYEISYVIMPPWRGQGYATLATQRLIALTRASYGAAGVMAVIKSSNSASRRVLQKLGIDFARRDNDEDYYKLRFVD